MTNTFNLLQPNQLLFRNKLPVHTEYFTCDKDTFYIYIDGLYTGLPKKVSHYN